MPHRFRVLALLFSLVLVMYFDRLCIAVAGPRIQRDLHLSPSQWGWVIGAFTLAYAAFEIPSGALGDRIGPRKVLTRIVLWWSVFTALTGAVSGYGTLLLVRFLFGAGEAGSFPNCASVISRWVPASERARSASVIWLATSVGGALTPLAVVNIQQSYGWRAAFYAFSGLGVVWAAVWHWWFRDTPREKAGVASEELALIGDPAGSRHRAVPWGAIFRNRNFQRILVMYHCYCWGAYFYLSWLHTYLQIGRGLTENEMKIASTLPACAGFIGVLAGGFLSDRLARHHSLRFARCSIGSVSLIVSGICMTAATFTRSNWWAVALITVGLGVMNAMLPVSWSLCVDLAREHAGAVSGAMNMAGQAGSLISAVAFGYLVEWLGSYDRALMPLGLMLIVGGCVFATIDPSQELIVEPELVPAQV
ncbi:MAG: MFS transporter [Acidobacteriota bacterium]|nr:MFS transporter [Acidobacteriota bacterium]